MNSCREFAKNHFLGLLVSIWFILLLLPTSGQENSVSFNWSQSQSMESLYSLPDSQNQIRYNRQDGLLFNVFLDENQTFEHVIALENAGADTLTIGRIFTQDPLLVTKYPKGKIPPKTRFVVSIQIPNDQPRRYNKSLTVFFNELERPFVMPINVQTDVFFNLASLGEFAKTEVPRHLPDALVPKAESKLKLLDSLYQEILPAACLPNDFIGWNCFSPFCMPNNTVWTLEAVLLENKNVTFWNSLLDINSTKHAQRDPIIKCDTGTYTLNFITENEPLMLTSWVDAFHSLKVPSVSDSYSRYYYGRPYSMLAHPLIGQKQNIRYLITTDYQYLIIKDHWDDTRPMETPPGKNNVTSHSDYWILKRK